MKPKKPGNSQKPAEKTPTPKAAAPAEAKAKPAKAATPPAPAPEPAKPAPASAPALAKPAPKAAKSAPAPAPAPVAAKPTTAKPVEAKAAPAKKAAPVASPTPAAPATTAKPAPRASKVSKLKIPPILLEGDAPAAAAASGPGARYVTGPAPSSPAPTAAAALTELPDSYGTQQLFLTARDPRWLFAFWDFSHEDIRRLNALSSTGHLALRVFEGGFGGKALDEIHVHPESRNWFVPVPRGATSYVADLGYTDHAGHWVSVARSGATMSPPDALSDDTAVRFATIPYDVPFAQLVANVKAAVREHTPLAEALVQLRAQGHPKLPAAKQVAGEWTPAQEKALAEVILLDSAHRIWIGSLEITELIRRRLQREMSSLSAAELGLPSSLGGAFGVSSQSGSVTSPFGGAAGKKRGFWFNVNAELIIYGATEPDATVTIGDRAIKLRPDGTFSFRFSLPDGDYRLPAAAHSADGEETRSADLKFHRGTTYQGEVGAHPQDKNLKPPVVAAVS